MALTIARVGAYDLTLPKPQVSTARMVTTTSLASTFSTLWIASPALLPFADVSAKLAVSGLLIPFGVGYVSLLLAEWRAGRDLTARARQQLVDDVAEAAR